MKFISQEKNLSGKTVLLRADLDAPHQDGKILDDYRVRMALPTIEYLYNNGAKVVIVSKTGKPNGSADAAQSLEHVGSLLADLLHKKFVVAENRVPDYDAAHFVFFKGNITDPKNREEVKKAPQKDIVLLENIRFYPGELNADPNFAKDLAALADIYVNDAFAMMHRNEASVSVLSNYLPSYAGLNVEREIKALDNLVALKANPFVVIVGGAKISDKVGTIRNLGIKASNILIGGGPANLFFLAKGYNIGKSVCEREKLELAVELIRNFKEKIILPIDVVVADAEDFSKVRVCAPSEIKANEMALDIGPQTILLFSEKIKAAKKMIWNGPMGLFEKKTFSNGTMSIARIFAARCKGFAYGVVGGGDTLEAINIAKVADQIDFVSTAGSATLDYLAGADMPGLKALK